jgi:hypothetical protein
VDKPVAGPFRQSALLPVGCFLYLKGDHIMRYGIPTCVDPIDPKSIYMRNMYHEFFWGPFKDEQLVTDAINALDEADPYWDYDPFCIICGCDPLPSDYVFGFPAVDDETKKRIYAGRKRA